jgi:aryl-alcohol dehydrogenase-like predicted oxidoreductase
MRARLFSSFASHLIITMTTTELTNDLVLQAPLAVGILQWGTTPLDEYVINSKGVISESEARQIVDTLLEGGVTLFDSAEGYGGGTSEKRLGRLLPSPPGIAMTKFLPVPWRWSHASLERAVRASCKRLQVSSIPIYLLHSPIHCWRPIEYWVQSVAICKQKGLVQTMGLSNCNANQVQRAVQAGKEVSLAYVLLLRVYNILLNVIPHDIL